MAKTIKEKIACPSCGKEVEVEMIESADGVADPKIKSSILEGTFGITKCPECGDMMDISYQSAYHDGVKKIMVWMMPPGKNKDVGEDVVADEDLIKTSSLMEGCALRKVRDKNELREKILLAENNRDDRVVELMKPGVYSALSDQIGERNIIAIFYEVNDEAECFVIQLNTGEIGTIPFPDEMYDGIKEKYIDNIDEATAGDEMLVINNRWAAEFVEKYMTKKF